ncbi:MAG TPA: LarC family nickel insertion protein [Actinomycetota bacterium]|nr:LarC family nickel insertion protein [Actinomycetota bacterium]
MRVAYFDCFSGISGAMALGALVHAGADVEHVSEVLATLPSAGFAIETEPVEALGIAALRLHVRSQAEGVIRTYASIRATLDRADLPDPVRHASHRVFRLLAEADARVHGREVDLVTFHDTADVDPLAAIVGTSVALDDLAVDRIFASPVPTGLGMTRTEHGMTPIPSPVVVSLLQGAPTYSRGIPVDLVTPVGAAMLAAFAEGYGDMPMMRADVVGYGAGTLRLDFPNVLRVVIGLEEPAYGTASGGPGGGPVELQARVDLTAEVAANGLEAILTAGATDAWVTPAFGSGGVATAVVHAVAENHERDAVTEALRGMGAGSIRAVPLAPEAT